MRLSDDDETPQQTIRFLSHGFHLYQFENLQALTLSNLHSSYILDKFLTECSRLPFLTHLRLLQCHLSISRTRANRLYDQIWNLPQLTHCYLDIHFFNQNYFPRPTSISFSLRYLSISNISCYSKELIDLFQFTPNLQSLFIDFMDYSETFERTFPIRSITRLKLSFDSSLDILRNLLQNLPDLQHLTLETIHIYMDGYQWEDFILQYLPKLKRLEMKMGFSPVNNQNRDEQLDRILDSFRTKFWLDEHQWFIRGHWYSSDDQYHLDFIDLFTLPYVFRNFLSYTGCTLVKSTCSSETDYWSYDQVQDLCYSSAHFNNLILSRVRLSSLEHLSLSLPFNELLFSVVTQLDRLKSLNISINPKKNLETIPSQLENLLDRASHLYSLSLGSWSLECLHFLFIEHITNSIRKLSLQNFSCGKTWRYFTAEQCEQFSQSAIGNQCEVLSIKVQRRCNVVYLVNTMSHLRALNVRCEDDQWTENCQDELVDWLRDYLPSSCVITRNDCYLRIWIR